MKATMTVLKALVIFVFLAILIPYATPADSGKQTAASDLSGSVSSSETPTAKIRIPDSFKNKPKRNVEKRSLQGKLNGKHRLKRTPKELSKNHAKRSAKVLKKRSANGQKKN